MNEIGWAALVGVWAVTLANSVAVLALFNHFGRMYIASREGRTRQGPVVGSEFRTRAFVQSRPALVLFTSSDCELCERLAPDLPEAARALDSAGVSLVTLCAGSAAQVAAWAARMGNSVLTVRDTGSREARRLGIAMTPFLIAVSGDGTVVDKSLVNDIRGIHSVAESLR